MLKAGYQKSKRSSTLAAHVWVCISRPLSSIAHFIVHASIQLSSFRLCNVNDMDIINTKKDVLHGFILNYFTQALMLRRPEHSGQGRNKVCRLP